MIALIKKIVLRPFVVGFSAGVGASIAFTYFIGQLFLFPVGFILSIISVFKNSEESLDLAIRMFFYLWATIAPAVIIDLAREQAKGEKQTSYFLRYSAQYGFLFGVIGFTIFLVVNIDIIVSITTHWILSPSQQ